MRHAAERLPQFRKSVLFSSIFVFLVCVESRGQNLDSQFEADPVITDSLTYKMKTMGGKQFWTDVRHCGGWRIQENAVSGHFRLLDHQNRRHLSGTQGDCDSTLDDLIQAGKVQQVKGRVVIVLHGLIRTTHSMRKLGDYLQEHGDFTAINFEYASTRRPVAYHATALAKVIDSLGDGVSEINFVAHSMGNIVIRHFLADLARTDQKLNFGRMVMIGPPNQGSRMASVLRRSLIFNLVAGPAGIQLGAGWDKLKPHLVTPDFEFGIIAGGQSENQKLSNFLIDGKDDFTVGVKEARLEGAADFLVKPLLHSTMMRKSVTLEATLNFLNNGYFVSADQRKPISESNLESNGS